MDPLHHTLLHSPELCTITKELFTLTVPVTQWTAANPPWCCTIGRIAKQLQPTVSYCSSKCYGPKQIPLAHPCTSLEPHPQKQDLKVPT